MARLGEVDGRGSAFLSAGDLLRNIVSTIPHSTKTIIVDIVKKADDGWKHKLSLKKKEQLRKHRNAHTNLELMQINSRKIK